MKVLMISGDRHMLEKGSASYARLDLQRAQVEQLDVVVSPQVHSPFFALALAQKNHYDVITAQDPFWRGLLAWILARVTGARLNVQIHTDLSALPSLRQKFAFFILRRADSVRVVSEKIKEFISPLKLRARIFVLPIYVDLTPFIGLPHESHPRFAKTILWVGRFEDEKDPLYALPVLEEVLSAGIPAGLVIVGDGSLAEKLKAEASRKGLPVEFPGWQNPAPYLATADVVLCTSKHESYGVSIIEALAARVPVVAPDIGIAKEAGATVVARSDLAQAVANVLRSGARGTLLLSPLTAEEWAKTCRESWL